MIIDMKKIFNILTTIVLALFVFASCQDDMPTQNVAQSDNTAADTAAISEDLLKKLDKENSLLRQSLSSLNASLENTKSAFNDSILKLKNDTQEQIRKMDEPNSLWNILVIFSSVFSVIALCLILKQKRILEKKDIEEIISDSQKLKKMKKDIDNLNGMVFTNQKGKSSDSLPIDFTNRLNNLERTIDELQKRAKSKPQEEPGHTVQSTGTKNLYASSVSQAYFVDCTTIPQENSIIKITLTSGEHGRFDIIDIKKFQQRNGLEQVVEIQSSPCTLAEARGYDVVQEGQCELISDGKAWKVTKKLKIKLK